ncbi:hypothetical protein D3C85_1216460 [compost metagenome]
MTDLHQYLPADVRGVALGHRVQPVATGGHFVFLAQPRVEGMGEAAKVAEDRVSLCRVLDHQGFTNHRADLHDHIAPGLARFIPAVVAGVVAKAHEDRQRQTQQREGRGADLGKVAGMQGFDEHDGRGEQRHHQAAPGDAFGNRTLEGRQHADQVGFGSHDHGFQPPVMFMKRMTWTSSFTSKLCR